MYTPKDSDAFPVRFGEHFRKPARATTPVAWKPAGKPFLFVAGDGRMSYSPPTPAEEVVPPADPAKQVTPDPAPHRYARSCRNVYRCGSDLRWGVEWYDPVKSGWGPSLWSVEDFDKMSPLTAEEAATLILNAKAREDEKKPPATEDLPVVYKSPAGCTYRLEEDGLVGVLLGDEWRVSALPTAALAAFEQSYSVPQQDYTRRGWIYSGRSGRVSPAGTVYRVRGGRPGKTFLEFLASLSGKWHKAADTSLATFYSYRPITQDEFNYFDGRELSKKEDDTPSPFHDPEDPLQQKEAVTPNPFQPEFWLYLGTLYRYLDGSVAVEAFDPLSRLWVAKGWSVESFRELGYPMTAEAARLFRKMVTEPVTQTARDALVREGFELLENPDGTYRVVGYCVKG